MSNFFDNWRSGGTGVGAYTLKAGSASQVPLTAQGYTGQTANLFELKNAAGTNVFYVDVSGNVTYLGDEYITDQLTVQGNASITGTLGVTGATTLTTLSASSVSLSSLSVSGASTFTGDVTANHNLTVNNSLVVNSYEYQNRGIYLGEQVTAPTHVAEKGVIYAKDASSITELFYKDSSGNETQITSGGVLGGDDVFIPDDKYLRLGNTAALPDVKFGWTSADEDADIIMSATGTLHLDGTTTRTSTAELLDIDATINTATATDDVNVATLTATRNSGDSGATRGLTVSVTTGNMADTVFSYGVMSTVITSACTQNTSDSSAFAAGAITADANCRETAFLAQPGYDIGLWLMDSALQMGSSHLANDCGTFTMIKGNQTGDPQVQFALSADANGDFSITADTGDITLTAADDFFVSVDGNLELGLTGTVLYPYTSDGLALGDTSHMWADLFLANEGVINFNNGNYTITHSAGLLTTNGALTITGALAGVTTLGATGPVTISPTATGNIFDFVLETEWTTGSVINMDFASGTTQTGDITGIYMDFNGSLAGVTDQDTNGVILKTQALTQNTANTTTYNGFWIPTAGALVQNTLLGTIRWYGVNLQMPNITQTTGTVNSYGVYVTGGTVTSGTEYGLYLDSCDAYFGGSVSVSGGTTFTLGATDYVYVNGVTTPHTDTNGCLKVACSTETNNVIGTNLTSANTATAGNTAYNLYSSMTSSAVMVSGAQSLYGTYTSVTKTGADNNAGSTALYGVYSTVSNTGSTDTGTKNNYAGYFTVVGDSAGASTNYAVYATAASADTNYAFYAAAGTSRFLGQAEFVWSENTTDAVSITTTALTTGSALVITGPSGATAGVTDALVKITTDIGNCTDTTPTFGVISSTATIDTTGATDTGVNLFLSTANTNSANANTSYGVYNTTTDAIALANTNYGTYTTVVNTGAIDTAITKTIYGGYISASGTGGGPTTAGTTKVYGQYVTTTATHAADFGTVEQYGVYVANGTSSTNGTSTKYGLYIESQTGADTNYSAYFGSGVIFPSATTAITITAATTGISIGNCPTGIVNTDVGATGEHYLDMVDGYLGLVIETGSYDTAADKGVVVTSTNNRPVSFLFDDSGDLLAGNVEITPTLSRMMFTVDQTTAEVRFSAIQGHIQAASGVDFSGDTSEYYATQGILECAGATTIGTGAFAAGVCGMIWADGSFTGTGTAAAVMAKLYQTSGTLTTTSAFAAAKWWNSVDAFTYGLSIPAGVADYALNVKGGHIVGVTTVNTATYDLLATDYILNVTRTATGTCAIDLKTAQLIAGRTIIVKDAGGLAGTNNITISTEGAETIDGAATYVMNSNYQAVNIYCDGSNFFIY